jgi:hypothetical protein
MKNFAEAPNPLALAVSFAVLRELARRRKEAGESWPWSSDTILAGPRSFTNTRREHDRTTKWLAVNLREPMVAAGDPNLPAAVVLFRMFNRIGIGELFFGCRNCGPSPFGEAVATNSVKPLQIAWAARPSGLKVGGAYTIASLNGYGLDKGGGLLAYYASWFREDGPIGWRRQFDYWARPGVTPTLANACIWFDRIGGVDAFTAAQFVADLKYVEPLSRAPDWHSWAAPGPGSRQGLNIVFGRVPETAWNDREWLRQLQWLQAVINRSLEAIGDEPVHAQDVQNICCDGVWKCWHYAHSGAPITTKGPLKGSYRPSPDRIPESEAVFRTRLEAVYEADRADLLKAGVGERNVVKFPDLLPDMLTLWRFFRVQADHGLKPGKRWRRKAPSPSIEGAVS